MDKRTVVLIIRDGWGENHNPEHDAFNAVKLAGTPVADRLSAEWPRTELMACGLAVGLPEGVMGNSEVGHQNIGAGRVVDQEIVRIDKAFGDGAVKDNPVLQGAFDRVKSRGGALHLMGLVSDAGVHAMLEHLYGLLRLAGEAGLEKVFVHCFTDGRDTSPTSGMAYIKQLEQQCAQIGAGRVASVAGRFWAMDRDLRWDRVKKAYDCLTGRAVERTAASAAQAVQAYYDQPLDASRKGDEFIVPTAIVDGDGKPVGPIADGDALVFFNFRGDRPRELTRAFIEEDFDGFDRGPRLDLYYATMTDYQKGLCDKVIFAKPDKMPDILGTYLADRGIPQFRCAETEKFPHVTFFFNDYREEPLPLEDREMIPSPHRRRSPPTTRSPRCPPTGSATRPPGRSAPASTGCWWSISPTPTWSATPARRRRRSRPARWSTPVSATCCKPATKPAPPRWSPPTMATATRCGCRKSRARTPPTPSTRSSWSSTARAAKGSSSPMAGALPTSPRPSSS